MKKPGRRLQGRKAARKSVRKRAKQGDIPALRRTEAALRAQIALTRAIVDQIPGAVFTKDAQGRFTMVNRGWTEMSGVAADKAIGRTVHDIYRPELAERFSAEDAKLIAEGPSAPPTDAVHHGPRPNQWRIVRKAVLSGKGGRVQGLVSTSTDISDLKRVESELRDQMVLTRALIDQNPNAMYLKDTEGRYLVVNEAWSRMLGVPAGRAIGRTMLELFPPEASRDRTHAEDLRLIARGEGATEVELERAGPDGKPQWLIIRKAVLRSADGKVRGLIGTNTDITRLKQYEAQLADRAKFIAELVEALPISVAMRDTEGRYQLVNRMWEHYFDLKRADVLGKRRRDLPGAAADPVTAEDSARIEATDRELLARGPDYAPEPRQLVRKGRSYLITSRVLADSAGKAVGILSAGVETTERHAMERELAKQKEILEITLEHIDQGITMVDKDLRAMVFNRRFLDLLEFPPERFEKGVFTLADAFRYNAERGEYGPGDIEEHVRKRLELARKFEPHAFERKRPNGQVLAIRGKPLPGGTGFVTTYSDVTDQRRAEEELRASVRLREEVERMSRHDLKTPLNSMIAMSTLLRESGKLAPEDAELLGTIERAGYRILNMVNLSLDLFRMETGSYQFNPRAVDLAAVARRVAADLESQAASKNIDVRVRANDASAASHPMLASADELLCYSMFANLVKNAIEAAPQGSVVSVLLHEEEDFILAKVHNPGSVPEAVRERFFQKYVTSGKSAGLGLGTYSARLMARVQGGEVTLQSSDASGTSLVVRLPAAHGAELRTPEEATEPAAARSVPAGLPALHVLVVDDDEFNRFVLRRTLPQPPLRLAMAVNGLAAIEAAAREWPDAVLLDLEMPVMDGYQTAAKLREMERSGGRKRCMIVAVSSNDDRATMERAIQAGCDDYLVKPASRAELLGILARERVDQRADPVPEQSEAVLLDADLQATLPAFLESREKLLDEMGPALAAGDRPAFKRLSHKLAGSFALYGFAWASAQCRGLEQDAAAGNAAELESRAAAVRAHLGNVAIKFKGKESA